MSPTSPSAASPLAQWSAAYWQTARRPLVSLAFVLPLLVVYELGVLALGTAAMRNGADVWLRQLLDWAGMGSYFLLPVFTVVALLAWHHTTAQRWQVSVGVLYVMLVESALLALFLLISAHVQGTLLSAVGLAPAGPAAASVGRDAMGLVGRLVGFFGAGIYEEVFFRLLLLPIVYGVIYGLGGSLRIRIVGSIVVTSFLFSMAHYLGPQGEPFVAYSFAFRFVAGAFFAVLFVYRGFGIAAGTHALYDIFVGLH